MMTEEEEIEFLEAMKFFGAKCVQKRETKNGEVVNTIFLFDEGMM